jgi:hypothetical protein
MITIHKLLIVLFWGITFTQLNLSLIAQELNIYETINYINSKLENCPCETSSGYAKYKIDWTSDGYLTVREITYSEYSVNRDVGNNIIKAKGKSLNFDLIEVKKNSFNSFLEIRCYGETPYQPANCVTRTNVPNGDIMYLGTLSICFNADFETQRSLLNAFKHLGSLIKAEGSQSTNSDPFSDENFNKSKTNVTPPAKTTTKPTSQVTKNQSVSNSAITTTNWVEKKGEVGNFYLSFPNYPKYQAGKGWDARDKDGQVTYLASYILAPSSGTMSIAAAEKYLLPSMFEGDIFVSKKYLTYNGLNALDFLYKTNSSPTLNKRGRVVVRGQQVYILQVLYYHQELANFERFVNSLHLY